MSSALELQIPARLDQTQDISGFEDIQRENEEKERLLEARAEEARREAEEAHDRPLDEALLDVWIASQIVKAEESELKAALVKLLEPGEKDPFLRKIDASFVKDFPMSFADAIEDRLNQQMTADLRSRNETTRRWMVRLAIAALVLLAGLGAWWFIYRWMTPPKGDNELDYM